ncbi:hypothetical protein SERLA73DRAFT_82881 [Serpula lacrymans var. lacrymans S7.3]|uniref:Uncharacterized protein n=1 Tax=Serpula lacrymans var. lacrymans (strain S7.3) TaxID=936435 RepID=F8PFJ5_SERL3|nr:hypothetical protein SERLA73DRAFT_82881 [Serpula lacrymans var. lacrymans S7.3]
MQFKEIPHKLIVAKRLSQCLNPALPTGVHQRALDVYTHILAVLGTEGLKRDLPLWSSGLFPFFEYAATSVKPTLLNIYDTHYLPLQGGLRPVMKAFILALLPGLEEETGEFFDKVLSLLDRLSGTVSPAFFFQNIWLVMSTMPSARGTALNFLSRRLPRLSSDEDITHIIGRDIGLMIRAFAAALEDDNLLVRRGALDILLQSMRIDSAAIKQAQSEDCVILMRAATGVVLRRDLSLNRRLYTWLLGPDEKSATQIAYLREHSLHLLKSTLREEMFTPSGDYSESRPFKVFISLLDKWEIGSPLTEALVYDIFKAIRKLIDSGSDSYDDMLMTASTLYEAIEPDIIWKQLLNSAMEDITGDGTHFEAIDMILFILRTFPVHDEDIQGLHLPVVFGAVMDVLNQHVRSDISRAASTSVREGLILQEEILGHLIPAALYQHTELNEKLEGFASTASPLSFARHFYGITSGEKMETVATRAPLIPVLEAIIGLSQSCAQCLLKNRDNLLLVRGALCQSLSLLLRMIEQFGANQDPVTIVSWEPSEWLNLILQTIDLEVADFTLVDRAISVVIALHQLKWLQPTVNIEERRIITKMVKKLFNYLHQDWFIYHVRAVNLIWSLEAATPQSHVESIIAQSMSSPESRNVYEAYEAFGVLWRLTDDTFFPGFKFKVPLMIVLDTLKHDDPILRRVGETWMRCSLKSYIRVLDPIMYDLLDPTIRRSAMVAKVHGREIQSFVYDRSFDQRYVNHLLEILLSIIRFGGQGFAKAARGTTVKRSQHPALLQRLEAASIDLDATYLDALVEILLRFLQSEPRESRAPIMQSLNAVIQSTSVDLLQAIVARGEIENITVEIMEAVIIGKLYYSVHLGRLDLQNKLLHILHSLISVSTTIFLSHPVTRVDLSKQGDGNSEGHSTQDESQELGRKTYAVNPLLVQTLIDGIGIPQNRAVLQHWLDFVLMAIPQFQPALQSIVSPMNDCLCRQLRLALSDVLRVSSTDAKEEDIHIVTDAEFIMLLNALERLVLLGLAYTPDASQQEDDVVVQEKPTNETSGILGYVSNVFTTENVPAARSPGYKSLHEGIKILYSIWTNLSWTKTKATSPKDDSLSLVYNRTRGRCRRVLEHLFRVHSAEVLESIIDCWDREVAASGSSNSSVFELVDLLIANVQVTVHMICDSILCRVPNALDKTRKQVINPNLSDVALFTFLEQYFQRLEGPLAIQVWARFLQLTKELASSTREFKVQNFLVMKSLCILAEKVTQTAAVEDKRLRKDLQASQLQISTRETLTKLLDSCIMFVGRTFDQPTWIRRSAKDALSINGRDSPVPRIAGEPRIDEKINASSVSLQESPRPSWGAELPSQISQFVAVVALPNLRKFMMDNDKVASVCNNIIYYIVNPSLKAKSKPMDVDNIIPDIIREMSRIPAALKVWRGPVLELLNDNRVFNSSCDTALKWKPIIKALYDSDKTAFTELLGKIATAPSTNIFTNREYEMLLRSMNLRRLSFILFSGEKNHFLTQLPNVQEKLVDILRNVNSPVVQSEVYLCIRVLLCRLSPHNLTSFWPVVLTELYRVFEQIITTAPSDGSEDLQLILSASKCLDLLLVLQTEEFQIHQWIFITDTVDAVYHHDDWRPEAMMDQLADIVGSIPIPEDGVALKSQDSTKSFAYTTHMDSRSMRRPLLNSLRQIDSIRDLTPFFSHVSIASYESVYACGGNIDWEAVERGVLEDMFDGR